MGDSWQMSLALSTSYFRFINFLHLSPRGNRNADRSHIHPIMMRSHHTHYIPFHT